MENAVFWGVMPCGSYKNRRFGGAYRLHHQGGKKRRARNNSSNLQPKQALNKYYVVHSISSQRSSVASTANVIARSPTQVTPLG
jgi:hypothetical protein